MFDAAEAVVHRVEDFLGLRRAIPASAYMRTHNKNTLVEKARASAALNGTLDARSDCCTDAYPWEISRLLVCSAPCVPRAPRARLLTLTRTRTRTRTLTLTARARVCAPPSGL